VLAGDPYGLRAGDPDTAPGRGRRANPRTRIRPRRPACV